MIFHELYFYTATILKWRPLLESDRYKTLVINSLKNLVDRKKIKVYGFVIMPNHIHLIWELLDLNGREKPHASFTKYTSHIIQKDLRNKDPNTLDSFKVDSGTRKYQFWQRDPLSIILYTPKVIHQKLDYIHHNPVKGKWMLAPSSIDYRFSSATFYEDGIDEFGILTHITGRL
ncbi:MAG: transposase [Bacteroidetes bacterium]|nr:transposase [Bacteroidota bacterium]